MTFGTTWSQEPHTTDSPSHPQAQLPGHMLSPTCRPWGSRPPSPSRICLRTWPARKVPFAQPASGPAFHMPDTHHLQSLPATQPLPATLSSPECPFRGRAAQLPYLPPSFASSLASASCFLPSLPPSLSAPVPSDPGLLPALKWLPSAPAPPVSWGEGC